MRARVSAESEPTGRPRPWVAGKGTVSLSTSKRYGLASDRSTSHYLQTPQEMPGHPGVIGQFDGPAIGLRGVGDPPRLGQQICSRRPGWLKPLNCRVTDRVQRAKSRIGAVDLAVDGRR